MKRFCFLFLILILVTVFAISVSIEKAKLAREKAHLETENASLKAQIEAERKKAEEQKENIIEQPVVVQEESQDPQKPTQPSAQAPTEFVFLGRVRSVQGDNSEARAMAEQHGYRLPSPSELSQISRNDISGIPSDGWIETSDPNTVCDIFFQQLRPAKKRESGMNLVVGCK